MSIVSLPSRRPSGVREGESVLALGYVRREVPDDAMLEVEGRAAGQSRGTQLDLAPARP